MGLLLLVRHGQASFGASDYDVLSEAGVAQSARLGEALVAQGFTPSVVRHGAMRRQRDTAEAMAAAAGWDAPLELDQRWDEFGHLGVIAAYPEPPEDGLDRRSFQKLFEQATARWASADHDDEYDETYAGFVGRVDEGLQDVVRVCESGADAVVVTSGGAIGAVCAGLVAVDAEPRELAPMWQRFNAVLVNASVTRVLVGSSGARLLTYNEHSHLERDQVTYR
jgi:broad specificity phosphatase PhoE